LVPTLCGATHYFPFLRVLIIVGISVDYKAFHSFGLEKYSLPRVVKRFLWVKNFFLFLLFLGHVGSTKLGVFFGLCAPIQPPFWGLVCQGFGKRAQFWGGPFNPLGFNVFPSLRRRVASPFGEIEELVTPLWWLKTPFCRR